MILRICVTHGFMTNNHIRLIVECHATWAVMMIELVGNELSIKVNTISCYNPSPFLSLSPYGYLFDMHRYPLERSIIEKQKGERKA